MGESVGGRPMEGIKRREILYKSKGEVTHRVAEEGRM